MEGPGLNGLRVWGFRVDEFRRLGSMALENLSRLGLGVLKLGQLTGQAGDLLSQGLGRAC